MVKQYRGLTGNTKVQSISVVLRIWFYAVNPPPPSPPPSSFSFPFNVQTILTVVTQVCTQILVQYWCHIFPISNVVVTLANFRQHITDIRPILSNWCLPILAIRYSPNIVPICVTIVPGFLIISELNNALY